MARQKEGMEVHRACDKKSRVQRDGNGDRETDATKTRVLGKRERERNQEGEEWEMPREPLRRPTQTIRGRQR